jgi:short-subunit dehydrogenase
MTTTPTRALVTGASAGLGLALAKSLALRGVEVWLAARREPLLLEQVRAIEAAGGKAHSFPLDISDVDGTARAVERLDVETGGIDLVIANAAIAGLPAATPTSRCTWPEVRDLVHTNLLGSLATLMPLVPRMLARGRGHIVGISSLAADSPNPRTAAYGASKAGLSYFLEAAGMELRSRGVIVTVVHPGFMRTPAAAGVQDPMPFIVEVEAAARVIDRAIRRRARMVRFPWPLAILQRLPRWLPAPLEERVVRWATRERPADRSSLRMGNGDGGA